MRGIERVVAALLLAGAVASAVALPHLAAGPDSAAPVASGAPPRVTTIVEAAPLPAPPTPKPKPKIVRVAFRPVVHAAVVIPAARPRAAARPQRVQRAPHVAPVAPDVVQAPAPVPTPSPSAQVAAPTAPAPVLPSLGLGHGKGHGKGHDKGDDGSTPIVFPQVEAPSVDNGKGNDNGKGHGHGHDKGA